MSAELMKAEGKLTPAKSKGGRPKHMGLILQQLPQEAGIVNCIVPLPLYHRIEAEVIKYHSNKLSQKLLCNTILEELYRHRRSGGIIEVYRSLDTTTTDLRKYRILEIITLPATCGPVVLVPGFTQENEYKLSMQTGLVRQTKSNTYANDLAKNHKNPDRR
jgi:hypothetical protein